MNLHRVIGLLVLTTTLIVEATFGQAGKSGLAFLKLGASARGISMGDAMSANVSGAAATYYNPAGLINAGTENLGVQVMFMHKEWIQDTRTEYLGTSVPLDDENALGFFLNSTTIADIELRTRPGDPEGTFTARNFSIGASYARGLSDNVRFGLTAKFLYEKIYVDEASGVAVDFGLQYRTPLENLSIGAVLANLGSVNELHNEKSTLPAMVRVGPAYSLDIDGINSEATLAADLQHLFPESKSYLNTGGEVVFDRFVAARAGYQFGSEGRGLSTGLGVRYGILTLDYAYSPLSSDLGNAHTISLALSF